MRLNIEIVANDRLDHSPEIRDAHGESCRMHMNRWRKQSYELFIRWTYGEK